MLGFVLLGAAAALLVAGADLFAEHAAAAGRRLGISTLAAGLLLAGAEPEELVTALVAVFRDRPGIAVGDALGANVTVMTLILGLAALVRPVPMSGAIRRYALGAAVLGGAAAATVRNGEVTRAEGALLVVACAVFVGVVWRWERRPSARGAPADDDEDGHAGAPSGGADGRDGIGARRGLVLALVGIAVMTAGGWLAVAGAQRVVDLLEVSDTSVGLTFVALATTAELLALVWAAARRALDELVIAGVLGSVVYNATVTLGGAALARPLASGGAGGAAAAAALLPVALVLGGGRSGRLTRPVGALLLAGYGVFVVSALR